MAKAKTAKKAGTAKSANESKNPLCFAGSGSIWDAAKGGICAQFKDGYLVTNDANVIALCRRAGFDEVDKPEAKSAQKDPLYEPPIKANLTAN